MLQRGGYDVVVRTDYVESEHLDNEGSFDLVVLTLHRKELEGAAAYSERLRKAKPDLPILLLTDHDVFVPRGTLSQQVETGDPGELMREIASMIAGSAHIREIGMEDSARPRKTTLTKPLRRVD